ERRRDDAVASASPRSGHLRHRRVPRRLGSPHPGDEHAGVRRARAEPDRGPLVGGAAELRLRVLVHARRGRDRPRHRHDHRDRRRDPHGELAGPRKELVPARGHPQARAVRRDRAAAAHLARLRAPAEDRPRHAHHLLPRARELHRGNALGRSARSRVLPQRRREPLGDPPPAALDDHAPLPVRGAEGEREPRAGGRHRRRALQLEERDRQGHQRDRAHTGHPGDVRRHHVPRDHRRFADAPHELERTARAVLARLGPDDGRPMSATAAPRVVSRRRPRSSWVRRTAGDALPPIVALVIALGAWEAVVDLLNIPVYLLPGPSAIAGTLWRLVSAGFVPPTYVGAPAQGILYDTYITFAEAMVGLLIGTTIGLVFAVIMTNSRFAEQALYPIIISIRSTPTIAVAPVFIIWFGFTLMPKAIVAALATFYPV